ncbi:unnamed protein product [Arctia plantaginis]|uniref:Uncharacterized protein n=1 Tax=Arctia plantaginis TaxID=874455 RepID=A0A8S0ZXH2_ARCPL|nr:unnamed protein product [Arctia plantaginis]
MPPPCHSHYPPARRAPRQPQSNSGIAKRVYVRSRGAALSALNRVVAADQASLTRLPTQPSRSPLPGPSARSSTPPSAALTPTPGAGEEFFTLSSFSRPSSPPTPGPSTGNLSRPALAQPNAAPATAPASAATPPASAATPPASALTEMTRPMPQRPKKTAAPPPRFPGPHATIVPDRFPSPPQEEKRRALFTTPPFGLPATSKESPMEVVGPSYATVAGALATARGGPPTIPAAPPDAPAAGLDAAPGANAPRNDVQKVTVVAAPLEGTKAKRTVQPQLVPKPATVNLDPRLTSVIGTLQKVLVALLEKRDPVPLILDCLAQLCKSGFA